MHASETYPESPHSSRTADRVTRLLLWLLALLELAIGAVALIGAVQLFRAPDAGMVLILAPVLAILALLLIAGAAIFVRRPWGRTLHMGVLLLIGLLLVIYVGPLLGPIGWLQVLVAVLVVVGPLTWFFRQALAERGMWGFIRAGAALVPGLLVGLLLLSVIPVYGIGWLIGRFRGHPAFPVGFRVACTRPTHFG